MEQGAYEVYVREYQKRKDFNAQFFEDVRDRDKVMLELLAEHLSDRTTGRLLDVCCGTGVFLHHVKTRFPHLDLHGMDLGKKAIEEASENPLLQGISFEVADLLNYSPAEQFDIVTANNALMFFSESEYIKSVQQIAGALRPGGALIVCDLHGKHPQDLQIVEKNEWFDGTLVTYHRSQQSARAILQDSGFGDIQFFPFQMTKDLPHPEGLSTAVSYTLSTSDDSRLSMRGDLLQPFCHVTAVKSD